MAQTIPLRERETNRDAPSRNDSAFELPPSAVDGLFAAALPNDDEFEHHDIRRISRISSMTSAGSPPSVLQAAQPSQAPRDEPTNTGFWTGLKEYFMWPAFKEYFSKDGNWRVLAGTAGTWALLDIPFYGLGLSYTSIIGTIWVSYLTDGVEEYDSNCVVAKHRRFIDLQFRPL